MVLTIETALLRCLDLYIWVRIDNESIYSEAIYFIFEETILSHAEIPFLTIPSCYVLYSFLLLTLYKTIDVINSAQADVFPNIDYRWECTIIQLEIYIEWLLSSI